MCYILLKSCMYCNVLLSEMLQWIILICIKSSRKCLNTHIMMSYNVVLKTLVIGEVRAACPASCTVPSRHHSGLLLRITWYPGHRVKRHQPSGAARCGHGHDEVTPSCVLTWWNNHRFRDKSMIAGRDSAYGWWHGHLPDSRRSSAAPCRSSPPVTAGGFIRGWTGSSRLHLQSTPGWKEMLRR